MRDGPILSFSRIGHAEWPRRAAEPRRGGQALSSLLEDKDSIRELLARYCHYGDGLDYERWLDLFVDDASLVIGEGTAHRGKSALREFVVARIPPEGRSRLKHCVMNEIIEVDGDRARALSTILELKRADDGAIEPRLAGRYEDELVRTRDGWRFQTRRVHLDLLAAREKG